MIDEIDRQILGVLEDDARTPPDQIATMLGLDPQDVVGRLERLEDERVLVKYRALVNWDRVDEAMVIALIEVRVSPQRDVGFDDIARRIARFPETRFVYLVSGAYDIAVQVAGRTLREVASFVSEKLAPLEGVQGTTTHFLLKRYKEDGELLDDVEETTRLPVTP
ncbi:MAG: Lrp/AsnC family transcriptional regulator [Chloroflexi bacterium]|nr:Lrp/AsnC family transcriptional regulator [Chloroflexota bacterium]